MRHVVVIAAAATALAGSTAAAGTAPAPRAALAVAAQRVVAAGVPGVVVLARDGRRTTVVARGLADRRTRRPMTVATRFRIGTMTMTFVATVVLRLVEEGKLELDEQADDVYPGLLPERWRITIRQLLEHTSNLYDYTQDARWFLPYRNGHDDYRWTPRRLLALSTSRPRQAQPPNVRLNGSYADYIALGLIVERVTHESIGDVLERRLFRPLGLRSTSFDTRPVTAPDVAHGYVAGVAVDPGAHTLAVRHDRLGAERRQHGLLLPRLGQPERRQAVRHPDERRAWLRLRRPGRLELPDRQRNRRARGSRVLRLRRAAILAA